MKRTRSPITDPAPSAEATSSRTVCSRTGHIYDDCGRKQGG
ncbi:MAG: hypothetical protein AB1640_07510 [bacterium]